MCKAVGGLLRRGSFILVDEAKVRPSPKHHAMASLAKIVGVSYLVNNKKNLTLVPDGQGLPWTKCMAKAV